MTISDMVRSLVVGGDIGRAPPPLQARPCRLRAHWRNRRPSCRNIRVAEDLRGEGMAVSTFVKYLSVIGAGVAFGVAASSLHAQAPGTAFKDCPDCPEMVVVPAGSFLMGSASPSAPGIREAAASRDVRDALRHRQIRSDASRVDGDDDGQSQRLCRARGVRWTAPPGPRRRNSSAASA